MRIIVTSNIRSTEASRLLEEVAASVESRGLGTIERTSSPAPGTKGISVTEIVVQLALGAAGNAVYELVKALVSRGVNRYKASGLTADSISVVVQPVSPRGEKSNIE